MFCKCMVAGYLATNADILPTNSNVVTFNISYQGTKKGADGRYEWNFIECVAFNQTAQNALSYLKKGDKVFVEGNLNIQQYVDKQGFTRNSTQLLVGMFRLLDSKADKEEREKRKTANSSNSANGSNGVYSGNSVNGANAMNGGYSVTNINDGSTISGRDKASRESIDDFDDEIPF